MHGPGRAGAKWQCLAGARLPFQILFDFAGYSDIAIGLGLLFGVRLPYNFNAPFRSTSIQDFWQRWHITLMVFLRDYLFHPLANYRIVPRRRFGCPAFRRHGADHGALRALAWPKLDLRAMGNAARLRPGRSLAVAPLRAATARAGRVGADGIFVLLTGVIFRAGTGWRPPWNIFQGLATPPDLEQGRHRGRSLITRGAVAFLLPASQDIVALVDAPAKALARRLGSACGLLAILIELGERNVYGFAYFQF